MALSTALTGLAVTGLSTALALGVPWLFKVASTGVQYIEDLVRTKTKIPKGSKPSELKPTKKKAYKDGEEYKKKKTRGGDNLENKFEGGKNPQTFQSKSDNFEDVEI